MEEQEQYEVRLLNMMLAKVVAETMQLDSTVDNSERLITLCACAKDLVKSINEVIYGNSIEIDF